MDLKGAAGLQLQVAVDDGEGSDSDSDTDEGPTRAEGEKKEILLHTAGALQPSQAPHMNGAADEMLLGEERLRSITPEPEQALQSEPADNSARPMQVEVYTSAADPPEQVQAEELSAKHDKIELEKPEKCLPLITVLADCTEEVSPRDPLAVIQIPQQHADEVRECIQALSEPASGAEHTALERPGLQKSTDTAKQPSVPALKAAPVARDISPKQAAAPQPDKQSGAAACADVAQQTASLSHGMIPDASIPQDCSGPQALMDVPAPSSAFGTGDAASPKRERRPSSKAAEGPAPAPKSPGSPTRPAQHPPALQKRPARSKRAWKEGTYIGNGMWLMCYCSRHTRALEEMGASQAVVSMTTGQALQDALSPQPKARQTLARPQTMPTTEPAQAHHHGGCPDGALQRPIHCSASAFCRETRALFLFLFYFLFLKDFESV